jgi:hypothetical protein
MNLYQKKYKNDKFILNGGMKEVEFNCYGIILTVNIPNDCLCPITNEIMEDPVITCDGYSYERSSITRWFTIRNTNPISNQILLSTNLIPNHTLKGVIIDFKESIYKKKILELNQLAEQNNSNAQYELGIAYSKYPPDIERSLYWLNKASENHNEQAQHEIINIRERLEREKLDRERLERERLDRERLEIERLDRERLGREIERLERVRLERLERLDRERFGRDRDRLAREGLERDILGIDRHRQQYAYENLQDPSQNIHLWNVYSYETRSPQEILIGTINFDPPLLNGFSPWSNNFRCVGTAINFIRNIR